MSKPQVNPFEFDSRMVEWNLKHNKITKEQLNTYLSSLPDDSANAESLEIEESDVGVAHLSNGAHGSHTNGSSNGTSFEE